MNGTLNELIKRLGCKKTEQRLDDGKTYLLVQRKNVDGEEQVLYIDIYASQTGKQGNPRSIRVNEESFEKPFFNNNYCVRLVGPSFNANNNGNLLYEITNLDELKSMIPSYEHSLMGLK